MNDLTSIIKQKKLLAVLTISDLASAVPLAKALYEGGISMIELTLRTDVALQAIKNIRKEIPEMLIGAGTVLKPEQVSQVIDAGAHFAVSPGVNRRVLEAAKEQGLFFAPGIMTPTDIEAALEYDCKLLKYFPAGTSGGMQHLRAMTAPYTHLGVSFIPLGGVTANNFTEFLADPLIAAVGGSWLATSAQVAACDCAALKSQAQDATAKLR